MPSSGSSGSVGTIGFVDRVNAQNSGPARDSLIRRINSLMARFNSLLRRNKFPVPMRREFRRKLLNCLLDCGNLGASETSSLKTPSSSEESCANCRRACSSERGEFTGRYENRPNLTRRSAGSCRSQDARARLPDISGTGARAMAPPGPGLHPGARTAVGGHDHVPPALGSFRPTTSSWSSDLLGFKPGLSSQAPDTISKRLRAICRIEWLSSSSPLVMQPAGPYRVH